MRSAANIKSHPLHPILVSFPIAFFIGAFVFEVLGFLNENELLATVAYYLLIAGIIGAIVAAIPGAVDYFMVVPPRSSGKSRATKHALLNVANLLIFFIAWLMKKNGGDSYLIIGLEAFGVILLSIAGWLGGTLVYRNQIAIDHRYAGAGKWNEVYLKGTGEIEVGATAELKTDQLKLIHINNKRIVIGKTDDGFVAFDDRCTHKGASLADGTMICGTVQCPWHGSQFEVKSGTVKAGPAKEKIRTYALREKNGKLYIDTSAL